MKLGIIHNSAEPDLMVTFLESSFSKKGIDIDLIHIDSLLGINGSTTNEAAIQKLLAENYKGVFNRVVPSSATSPQINCVLETTSQLEDQRLPVLNPVKSSQTDYSKYQAYQTLKAAGVSTPETILITDYNACQAFVERFGLPLVVKDDQSGTGVSVQKITTASELEEVTKSTLQGNKARILQEFIHPIRAHDCRVTIVNGELLFTYGRTLADHGGVGWKGSKTAGSSFIEYTAAPEEINLALRSTKAINAGTNAADVYFSERGPVIIENNPTPGYITGRLDLWGKKGNAIVDLTLSWLDQRREELVVPVVKPAVAKKYSIPHYSR